MRLNGRLLSAVFSNVQTKCAPNRVDEEALRSYVLDWQAREMVTKAGEAYVKTGHRPYRTDQGLLSKGSDLDR